MKNRWRFIKYFGPGLIAAASAVGTSHLVQSTQAGAQYGYQLILAILMINFFKYPFFEFGSRYPSATGENLVQGYARHNFSYIYVYGLANFVICCISISALALFLGSLACSTLNIPKDYLVYISSFFIVLNVVILTRGKYGLLELTMKVMLMILILFTLLVVFMSMGEDTKELNYSIIPDDFDNISLVFVIALFGWMPTLLEGGIWQSIWFQARDKKNKKTTKLKYALIDFNFGYISCALLAILFVYLGADVMYGMVLDGKRISFDNMSGIAFSNLFLESYHRILPYGLGYLVNISAIIAILSSLITVQDALFRSTSIVTYLIKHKSNLNNKIKTIPNNVCIKTAISSSIIAICIIMFFINQFRLLLNIAMITSFIISPITAFMTYRVIFSNKFPSSHKPKLWLKILSIIGASFLLAFTIFFLVDKVI